MDTSGLGEEGDTMPSTKNPYPSEFSEQIFAWRELAAVLRIRRASSSRVPRRSKTGSSRLIAMAAAAMTA